MVIFDMPYGFFDTKEVPWDIPLTKAAVVTMIQQLAAVIVNDDCIGWFWINPDHYHMMKKCLAQGGWKCQVPFGWYKPNSNVHGVLKYIPSFEQAIVATKGDRSSVWRNWSSDFHDRHNHVTMNGVTSFYKHEGKVVNPAQKPVQLMQKMIERHCAPGSTVLVIGFGSGTDLIASLSARCHVIGVEADEFQYKCGLARLRHFVDAQLQPPKLKKPAASAASESSQAGEPPDEAKEAQPAVELTGHPCIVCNGRDGVRTQCADCKAWFHSEKDACSYQCAECAAHHGDNLCERKQCHDKFYNTHASEFPFHAIHKHLRVNYNIFFEFLCLISCSRVVRPYCCLWIWIENLYIVILSLAFHAQIFQDVILRPDNFFFDDDRRPTALI